MPHPSAIQRCTAQKGSGEFCDAPSMPDVPFPICGQHAYRLWRRLSEIVTEAERDKLRILTLAFEQIDEKRAREDRRRASADHVVYYVLVGDLLKIGTTSRLKARLAQFPPNKKLLAVEPGSYELERKRHVEFADLLAHGNEWFRFEGALIEHVQNMRQEAA